jgi:general secretion pathway protein L
MNTILTLIIPSDWPQQRRACPWLLHNAGGRLLRRGCSEPAHWPGVGGAPDEMPECRILLAGRQVAGRRVRLPAPPLGRRPEVVGAALEDVLLDAPEQLAFAVAGKTGDDGTSRVGVVSRQRLAGIVALLRELGLPPHAAWPLGMAMPAPAACLVGDELCVVAPDGEFAALGPGDDLAARLGELAGGEALPLHVVDADPDAGARLAAVPGLRPGGAGEWLAPAAPGFLDGELAPPRRRTAVVRHFSGAARLAAAFAGVALLLSAAQWGWHAWQAARLRDAIAAQFRAAQPQAALVDPLLQMQRLVDSTRHAGGQLVAGDFLALADTLAELPAGATIAELRYRDGRLEIVAPQPADAVAALAAAAERRGQRLSADGGTGWSLSAGSRR